MARFENSQKQGAKMAGSIMRELQGVYIKSVGTVRNYEQALKNVATVMVNQGQHLRDLDHDRAISYLEQRAEEVGQKSLDIERQAIQSMFRHVTGKLDEGETLRVIRSEHEQVLHSRAYTQEQTHAIADNQREQNALSTEIAYAAGLRAKELITLLPIGERPADIRQNKDPLEEKFMGREGQRYSVIGKGGLVREVMIPDNLAERLENRRLDQAIEVIDRNIIYQQHYNISAGRNWSQSFSSSSLQVLGWSNGAHGLRHSYAQERLDELRSHGLTREYALEVVSQELGHFRPDITEIYLR
jgi:integrase